MTWVIGVAVDTGVRILRQPQFGGLAALDEVQQLDIFAEMLEHVHHPDGRSFDHLEDQVTGDGMGAHHGDENDAIGLEVALVQRDGGGRRPAFPFAGADRS